MDWNLIHLFEILGSWILYWQKNSVCILAFLTMFYLEVFQLPWNLIGIPNYLESLTKIPKIRNLVHDFSWCRTPWLQYTRVLCVCVCCVCVCVYACMLCVCVLCVRVVCACCACMCVRVVCVRVCVCGHMLLGKTKSHNNFTLWWTCMIREAQQGNPEFFSLFYIVLKG